MSTTTTERGRHDDHHWLMDAVVLVGGEGTRLRPLTYEIPKQMLPVVGRPMIAHVIEWLAGHGVDRAVLSLGYRADAFIEAFPDNTLAGVALEYVVEPEPLDTAGAVRFAAEKAGVSDTFLVLNGDVLTDFDASGLVEFHRSRPADASIALDAGRRTRRSFGVVPTDEDGRVTAFIEKPPAGQAPTNLINAGIYVLETSVLERIPRRAAAFDRTRDLPGARRRRDLCTRLRRTPTGSTPGHPINSSRPSSTSSQGRRACVPPAPEIRRRGLRRREGAGRRARRAVLLLGPGAQVAEGGRRLRQRPGRRPHASGGALVVVRS